MFKPTHFIWLAICVLIISFMLLLTKKLKIKNNVVLSIMCVVALLSELIKIFLNMTPSITKGYYLEPGSLPFHLCSIQIFFIFGLKFFIKNENIKKTLYNFMVPTTIIGAIMSIFIPTIGTSFLKTQVYQYFIYHAFLIFYGIYLLREGYAILDFKATVKNISFLLLFVLFNLWVNSVLSIYDTNFMYLTRPPMDNLPILNLNHGWIVYFICLVSVGLILMILFHLPFVIINNKKKLNKNEQTN